MLVLKKDELRLIEDIETYLDSKAIDEGKMVRARFDCLQKFAEAISQYPSIRETQILRGEQRDEAKLLEALCSFAASSRLLHIPARVVAVRSFLVAKFQTFSFLAMLVREIDEFYPPLRTMMLSVICTLMAEEVYFSCLDDPSFPRDTKTALANDLLSLWDSGTDLRSVRHLPALESLWFARDAAPPSFGTMDGASELLRITIEMEEDWRDFLVNQSADNETRWALEEFLFGLSHEEIQDVRIRLRRFGITAVGADEVRSYLGSQPAYAAVRGTDPRSIYDFYVDRRDAAVFRKKISAAGPQKTLEEIYLKYRIAQE
ncbi:hypothetical protein FACS189498_1740 [Spirochaetia bacterium]|nr:hypothetical protein FACS189498_1740 [Spirochaetia bacterium]